MGRKNKQNEFLTDGTNGPLTWSGCLCFDCSVVRLLSFELRLQKDLTACLTKVECPVFVTIAGKDNFFLPATGLAILPLIQNVQHWIAEESGHMIHTSSGPQAAEFFARSLAFLNSLSLTANL